MRTRNRQVAHAHLLRPDVRRDQLRDKPAPATCACPDRTPRSLFCDNNNELLPDCSASFIAAGKWDGGGTFARYDDKRPASAHRVCCGRTSGVPGVATPGTARSALRASWVSGELRPAGQAGGGAEAVGAPGGGAE